MSSSLLCECGARVEKNLFSGHGVSLLVPEEGVDKEFSQVSGEALVSELLRVSRLVVTCRGCSRLYIIDDNGDAIQSYRPEVIGPGDS
jgi:hypothetical protein